MSGSSTTESESERRIYHARLVTCLAVIPTFMGLAALITGASVGNRDLRGLLLAHPLAIVVTFAIAMLFVLAWWLMGRRERAGVLLASTLFALMLVSALGGSGLSYMAAAFAVVGLVVAVRAWPVMRHQARVAS